MMTANITRWYFPAGAIVRAGAICPLNRLVPIKPTHSAAVVAKEKSIMTKAAPVGGLMHFRPSAPCRLTGRQADTQFLLDGGQA